MKKVMGVYCAPRPHWVGDGFPARSLFSYSSHGRHLSPFLLLDYAGPHRFEPTTQPRGVGQHPHRGFETVTIVYEGEVAHRDSTGAGGTIGPGDVQWMTAASGILHEEFHSPGFSRSGGTLDMVQLWVNLPARDKMGAPGYQTLLDRDIPSVALGDDGGRVRVIAGEYAGHAGPARTHTPIDVWDVRLRQGHHARFDVAAGRTLAVVVLKGAFTVVAAPDGRITVIPVASPALARAGTGDVLAGLIVGLRAQGLEAFEAAVAGAWIHAQAGLYAADDLGTTASVLAGDVLDSVSDVLSDLE